VSKARPGVLSLNGGEVDREVIARSDIESYANKAQVMENALPGLKGGMFRGPGTRFIGYTAEGPGEDSDCNIRTWRYARSQAFTVEISAGRLRLIYGIGFVQVGGASAEVSGAWVDASTGGASTDPNAPPWQPTPEVPNLNGADSGSIFDYLPFDSDPNRPGVQIPDDN
jgi:hypothetical protein